MNAVFGFIQPIAVSRANYSTSQAAEGEVAVLGVEERSA